ncbi:hypothetical protein CTA1_12372 [Colletotrichum tanaceti]|uniref:Uncharacterized protein n=1 Tax=Colletotrichum tanaceti TaxID=1306861 RepID=A0A4U6XM55_9PEZI|nr:hypothetical protein CTA1_12372 [Colletotrichum tanaceti]
MSEATPPKAFEAWKFWSKQQIHPAFFLTEPDVSNTYRFDEGLGAYLGFAGKEVIRLLENVTWDDEAQAPADKTKQQVYVSMIRGPQRIQPHCVPFAPDLEALRIINNLRLPDDIVDLLTQAGWDPYKCCDPYSKGQERKLRPESMSDLVSAMTSKNSDLRSASTVSPLVLATKATDSVTNPITLGPPGTDGGPKETSLFSTAKMTTDSSLKSTTKATSKKGQKTGPKTPLGWKRWARKNKNHVYGEPEFQSSNRAIDNYLMGSMIWNENDKKPAEISKQLPHMQLMTSWGKTNRQNKPPPPSMMEAIRILNNLDLPAPIVDMLAEAGWDAEKCCNAKLTQKEKRLVAISTGLKRSIEDEDDYSPQDKKQKISAGAAQKDPSQSWRPEPLGQSSREPTLSHEQNIIKNEISSPLSGLFRPLGRFSSADSLADESEDDGLGKHPNCESPKVEGEPHILSGTNAAIAAVVNHNQTADTTKAPKVTHPISAMNSSLGSAPNIGTSSPAQPKVKKCSSRKELKRAIDAIGNKLQDQAGQLCECHESLNDHSSQLRDQSSRLLNLDNRLRSHSDLLQKQDATLKQLREDNQALRSSLQQALLSLSQAVNILRKSNKGDKRALRSTKKRAERELKEFKSADKTTKVLKRSLKSLDRVLAPGDVAGVQQVPGGNSEGQEQEG